MSTRRAQTHHLYDVPQLFVRSFSHNLSKICWPTLLMCAARNDNAGIPSAIVFGNFKLGSFDGTPSTIKFCVVLTTEYVHGMENEDVGTREQQECWSRPKISVLQRSRQFLRELLALSRRADNFQHLSESTSYQDCLVEWFGSMCSVDSVICPSVCM